MSSADTQIALKPKDTDIYSQPPSMPKFGIETVRLVGRTLSKILFRIKYINQENIPSQNELTGGLLICANHQTYFDPFWICFPVKRPLRYMAWDKATEWFLVGDFIRSLGAFPVNVERGGKETIKISLGWLRNGGSLVVFPEGEREFSNGEMLDFKNGAVRIAMQAGVPILPVTVRGGNKVWSQGMTTPRLRKVEIIYHPVFQLPPAPEGVDSKTHIANLNEKLRTIIASEMRP